VTPRDPIPWQGRVLLDWRRARFLRHDTGYLLCCDARAGTPPRHPDPCGDCGYGMPHRPPPDPCQFCGKTAHFMYDGKPTHKVCLEIALAEGRAR